MTVRKIKIIDDDKLRNEIDQLYEKQEQIILAMRSLEMAKHIIEITNCLVRTDIDLLIYVTQLINKIIPLHKDGTAIYFSKNTGMEQSIFPI